MGVKDKRAITLVRSMGMKGPGGSQAKDLLKSDLCLQNSGNNREPSKNLGGLTVGP